MGALHEGHASLIDRARRLAGKKGTVVVSIFVNPTQFGPSEDFSRYPRTFAADRALCEKRGADVIFHPTAKGSAGLYSENFSTWVSEEAVSQSLCGAARPGHFRGVTTVVLKLFQIVQPDSAIFGLKDYQQCAVIRRMVRDLNLPVRIVAAPTSREADGLARSSRNAYLTPEERAQAPIIRQALLAVRATWRRGGREAEILRRLAIQILSSAPLARLDYVEIVDGATLAPIAQVERGTVIAAAVFFGATRLIDNLRLT
jgi:pantoate--beta-alanine ligase